MVVKQVPETINFPEEEENVLKLWKQWDVFKNSLKQSKGRPRLVHSLLELARMTGNAARHRVQTYICAHGAISFKLEKKYDSVYFAYFWIRPGFPSTMALLSPPVFRTMVTSWRALSRTSLPDLHTRMDTTSNEGLAGIPTAYQSSV
jgi:hypothetical protein